MLFKCIILVCMLTIVVTKKDEDDDCVGQVNEHHQCHQDIKKGKKASRDSDRDKLTSDGLECFKTYKCKIPSDDDVDKKSKGKGGKEQGFHGPDGQKRKDCYNKLRSQARGEIEKCVQAKSPSFKFPDEIKEDKDSKKDAQRRQGVNLGNLYELVDESCPDNASKENTRKCLDDSFQKRNNTNSEERSKKALDRNKQNKANKDKCNKKISKKCRTAYNQTNKDICDCAKKTHQSKITDFENDYNSCSGATVPTTKDNSNSPLHRTAQYHGSGVEFMVTNLCAPPEDLDQV